MLGDTAVKFAILFLVAICWVDGFASFADPAPRPPIELYGERAGIRSMSMSPSGDQIAFIRRTDGRDILFVYSEEEGAQPKLDISTLQGNWVWFPTEDHVIIRGYDTRRIFGYKGKVDYSAAFSYQLDSGNLKQLLLETPELYPAQSGLGRIIGKLEGSTNVLMPAWTGRSDNDASKAVFRVDLNKSRGRVFKKGNRHTLDWLIAPDGTLLAREDMNNDRNRYAIHTEVGGKRRKIFEKKNTERPPFSVIGIKADRSALVLSVHDETVEHDYVEMDFDGNQTPIRIGDSDASIRNFFMDQNKVIHGVSYSGMQPSYYFFDETVDQAVSDLIEKFGSASIDIVDRSDDWSKILVRIFDFRSTGSYLILDTQTGELTGLISSRPEIPAEAVGDVVTIEYQARDGLTIPGILTWPAGVAVDDRRNLPTIVMPHGGPRSHDTVDFDWMAQYFANRGYLILQPNFRGSSGFTKEFMYAGNGEWGGKMQDDVTDGLQALVNSGFTNPDRTCIIGWSYGGYAALAGGAFTPELYKCVVAIAPVSDLRRMFADERKMHGRNHYYLDYWEEMIGDPVVEKEKLEATSPVNFAEAFQAPVLLIHGRDDVVVDYRQSTRMQRALERAGKDVTLELIKDEGHSLLDSENRLDSLQTIAEFVEAAIGDETSAP